MEPEERRFLVHTDKIVRNYNKKQLNGIAMLGQVGKRDVAEQCRKF